MRQVTPVLILISLILAACDRPAGQPQAPLAPSAVSGTAASVDVPAPPAPTREQWMSFVGKAMAQQAKLQQCTTVNTALIQKVQAMEQELRRLRPPAPPVQTPPRP